MRVWVDQNLCQGHGLCRMSAPSIFEVADEDGHAHVIDENIATEDEDDALLGVDSCPDRAIQVEE